MANTTIYPLGPGGPISPAAGSVPVVWHDTDYYAGVSVAVKKAEQAVGIRYRAQMAYPTNSSQTGGAAGNHAGFPYSSTKEIRKYIHWEVSERTFMTAVRNPWSLFYTEDISRAHGRSGYGFTYDGLNCGTYYGMVCAIFTGWAIDSYLPFETEQMDYAERIGAYQLLTDQSAQGVLDGDLVWIPGHTQMVTKVERNASGTVTYVTITESSSNVASTRKAASTFNSYLSTKGGVLYRPATLLRKNLTYTPSQFVAIGDEPLPTYPYNDEICFYAGDYAAFRAGQPCWVNYTRARAAEEPQDISYITAGAGNIALSDGVWKWGGSAGASRSKMIPILPGVTYKVTGYSVIAVVAEGRQPNNTPVTFATGFTDRTTVEEGDSYTFTAPADARFLYYGTVSTSGESYATGNLYRVYGTAHNYPLMQVYKDDTLVDTLTLDADTDVHRIEVTASMTGAGYYKARIGDGVNWTDYTRWQLVDAQAACVARGDGYRVSFSSSNGTPVWISAGPVTGGGYCWHRITDAELAQGYADLDFDAMMEDQWDDGYEIEGGIYAQVEYMADYGGVVSERILFETR